MEFDWFSLLTEIAHLTPIIPIAVLLLRKSRIQNTLFWILLSMLLVDIVTDVIGVRGVVSGFALEILMHFHSLLAGLLVFGLFKWEFNDKGLSRIINWIAIFYTGYFFYFLYVRVTTQTLLLDPYILLLITGMGLALFFFYRILKKLEIPNLLDYPFFWLNTAILLYYGTTIGNTLAADMAVIVEPWSKYVWTIQFGSTIMYNLVIAYGVWVKKPK